ncbi:MAG: bifunctional DNA-formamidopyrimidine glycosylase/DNA-(apurinic or apyrimidinic site) lyase [Gammaproteobacteria bacterium]
MPELPEVETTARGIRPHIKGFTITNAVVRQSSLRHPVPRNLRQLVKNQKVIDVSRRAKYVLVHLERGHLIIHLGMTGNLRVLQTPPPPQKHDHVDVCFEDGRVMRYTDPRRFGCILHTKSDPEQHKLLKSLGPEPLSDEFTPERLHELSRKRKVAVKNFIMNGAVVVGVGNIYASESLFRAGVLPHRQAGRVSLEKYVALHGHIKDVLNAAIKAGGTTLRDYTNADGFAGYFSQELDAYGRKGEDCNRCGGTIKMKVIGQRSSFYCTGCQN